MSPRGKLRRGKEKDSDTDNSSSRDEGAKQTTTTTSEPIERKRANLRRASSGSLAAEDNADSRSLGQDGSLELPPKPQHSPPKLRMSLGRARASTVSTTNGTMSLSSGFAPLITRPAPSPIPQHITWDLISPVFGNHLCVDCGTEGKYCCTLIVIDAFADPKWATINLVALMCIKCSGIHRSLGVHISKIRSTTLDDWEPETMLLFKYLGNRNANSVFEELYQHEKTFTNQYVLFFLFHELKYQKGNR